MSLKAMAWAIDQMCGSPSAKVTLWSIANHANVETWCAYPSQSSIMNESEQSADSVQRRIPGLEKLGLIKRVPLRYDGRKTVDFYILPPSPYWSADLAAIEGLLPRGFCVDPKWAALHVAANSGSAKSGTSKESKPATLPQTLPQIAANATALMRQHEPVTEPTEPSLPQPPQRGGTVASRERERRDDRKEATKPRLTFQPPDDLGGIDADLAAIVKIWRPPGAVGNIAKARALLADLLPDDRKAARDAAPRFLRGLKDAKKDHVPMVATYLADRAFERFPEPRGAIPAEPSVELKPYVVPLWAMLWGAVDSHLPADKVEYFLNRISKGLTTPASALPKDGDTAPLVPIKIGSDDHAAWVGHCEKLGFRLPRPDAVPVVYVPSKTPPALKSTWKGYRLAVPQRLIFRSPAWWWRLHKIDDGTIIEAQLREGGRSHGSVAVDMGPWPSSSELASMVEIVRLSDAWRAWAKWFDTKGVYLDLWSESSIWCPSEYPPLSVASTKELTA